MRISASTAIPSEFGERFEVRSDAATDLPAGRDEVDETVRGAGWPDLARLLRMGWNS